jgi:UDP-glucose 4-epimerase
MYSNVLVTGGCGYLGSQLIRSLTAALSESDSTVRILDNFSQGRPSALMDLPRGVRYEFIEGDVLDPVALDLALQNVDVVIHLAAVVRTPLSFDNPAWLEQVNHWGTAHLAEACLRVGVRRLVFTSTTAVYGPGGPSREQDTLRPQGHYSQTKLRAEESLRGAAQRGLEVFILRLGVLYGLAPVIRFDSVANRLAYLAGVGRAVTIYGDGRQKRSYLHVQDAVGAILHVLYAPSAGAKAVSYNVVSENGSILDVVDALRLARPDLEVRFTEQDIRTHYSFTADGAQLAAAGCRPHWTLVDGLAEISNRFVGLAAPASLRVALE